MDLTTITGIISQVGFPIAAFFLLFKAFIDNQKQHQEDTEKWIAAINNNTTAIHAMIDRYDTND